MPEIKNHETAPGRLDLSDLQSIDFETIKRAVTVTVRNAFGARELVVKEGLYPDGKSDKQTRLHELEADVGKRMKPFSCAGRYYTRNLAAWDAISGSINESFGNDDNFLAGMTNALFLAEQAKDPKVVRQWLGDKEFILGIKHILRDLYGLQDLLKENKGYQSRYMTLDRQGNSAPLQSTELQKAFCKRGLAVAEIIIEVLEFLVRAADGGSLGFTLAPVEEKGTEPVAEKAESGKVKKVRKGVRKALKQRLD
jgi:hypothetical protein